MLTKILFTLLVVVVVALIFRNKADSKSTPTLQQAGEQGSLSTRTVAYTILGVLVSISILVFALNYQSRNRIINIRVISDDGVSYTYQALQKSIKGRQFITLDDKKVTLGESDRIEIQDQ